MKEHKLSERLAECISEKAKLKVEREKLIGICRMLVGSGPRVPTRRRGMKIRFRCRFLFELRDICIGIRMTNTWDFPECTWRAFDIYIYILPMLPIRLTLYRPEEEEKDD